MFPFLYVKANSRKFVKKYPLLFFRKMLMSALLFRSKANYVKKKDLKATSFDFTTMKFGF